MFEKFENGNLIIYIEGKIDSANATQIGQEIDGILAKYDNFKLVLDAEELKYISSAGLRVILSLRKKYADLKIVGVSSEVYEVFEMTGFVEMLDIEKGYRKLSVDGCEILGEGSNGVVYRYDPEIVVKVYRNPDAIHEIQKERQLARRALILGIPTAIPFDIVKVGDKFGSVFELLNAKSFSKLIASEPENTDKYIQMFVDLLKRIHSTEVDTEEMGDVKRTAIDWACYLKDYLPAGESKKIISLIEAVPERNTMIHGDYHTNNVEMQNREVLLIDMDTLSYGHPVFEFASMFLGFQGFSELDHEQTMKFLKLPYETATYIWKKSLELYFETDDKDKLTEIENKAKIIGYTRMMRRTIKRIGFDDPYGLKLIEHCKNQLHNLLAVTDSLSF